MYSKKMIIVEEPASSVYAYKDIYGSNRTRNFYINKIVDMDIYR